ncbi:MAG TPA: pepsin-like aspartic protease [Rhodopila sp.]|nr:pepsin-like aspartic protease [Rhodopila sp.]
MADPVRFPISNAVTGNCFTLALSVGSQAVPMNVLLDTGSSMTVVYADPYDPGSDTMAATTRLMQSGSFGDSGRFVAGLVRTRVALPTENRAAILGQANLGVVRGVGPSPFGKVDGILGLAYPALNSAVTMPGDTWANRYTAAQLGQGQPAGDLPTCLDQLVAAGSFNDTFALAVRRSFASQADDGAAAERLNAGVFVLGGGEACTDLYTGDFVSVAVVHEAYYNTNLISVQVGDRTIQVQPTRAGDAAGSNSFIDSGDPGLTLDSGLYQQVIGLFNAVDPTFGPALQAVVCDQTQLDLARWPTLRFVLQGSGGAPVTLTVEPRDYWQFDGYGAGTARAVLDTGGAPYPGQSILGLPLLAGRYAVFDRGPGGGNSVIKFAAQPDANAAPLVA